MRSPVIRLVLLVVIAGVAVGVLMLVPDGGDGPETMPVRTRLYSVPQDAITSVAVRTETNAVAFERRGSDWYFAGDALVPVNPDRWGGVVLLLSGPEVERRLPAPRAPDEFGLGAPAIVSVGLDGGRRVAVRLGAETPDERNIYAQLHGESEVALVNAPWAQVLLRLAAAPPLPYWYYRIDPARVRLFEVESASGIVTFLLGLPDADGEPSDRVVQGDLASELTDVQRDAVLDIAGGPDGFAVAPWPDGLSPEDAGLDPPRGLVRVTYELAMPLEDKSAVSIAYAIGAPASGGDSYYAVTPDTPLLLTFDAVWVEGALSLAERDFAGEG